MEFIQTIDDLHELYGQVVEMAQRKVATRMTREYRVWIERSRFCILSTVGPEGTDATPRGDVGPVVRELDDVTLAMPDWRGNNRIDSLRNIVRDDRVSLLFMVFGSKNVVRVNGTARLTADPEMRQSFEHKGTRPRSVIVVKIAEIYVQCGRALLRSGLWSDGDQSGDLPSVGEIVGAITDNELGGPGYDGKWAERAKKTMW